MSAGAQPDITALPVTRISSNRKQRIIQGLRDLVVYRELFYAFVLRDIKVRYKQTFLGVIWVVLQPLISGVVFAAVFGLVRGQFNGLQDMLHFMAALVPWTSFQQGLQMASTSLEQEANMISKIYFPRMIVPSSRIIGSVVDFFIAFPTLLAVASLAGVFDIRLLLYMPLLLLIQVMTGLGLGLIFSIMNAQYRDIKYAIPFILQLGLFITVLIPLEQWRTGEVGFGPDLNWITPYAYQILSFNPMASVVESYRLLTNGDPLNWLLIGKGFGGSVVLLSLGIWLFGRREKLLVDII